MAGMRKVIKKLKSFSPGTIALNLPAKPNEFDGGSSRSEDENMFLLMYVCVFYQNIFFY